MRQELKAAVGQTGDAVCAGPWSLPALPLPQENFDRGQKRLGGEIGYRELLLGVGNPPRYISEHLVVFKGFSRAQVRAGNSGAIKRILGRRRREQQPWAVLQMGIAHLFLTWLGRGKQWRNTESQGHGLRHRLEEITFPEASHQLWERQTTVTKEKKTIPAETEIWQNSISGLFLYMNEGGKKYFAAAISKI